MLKKRWLLIHGDFEQAAKLRDESIVFSNNLVNQKEEWLDEKSKRIITILYENIAEVVSDSTGIPLTKISQNENEKLNNIEDELNKVIIGQNEAVELISKSIKRGRVGLNDPSKPIGSFLFLGPTGVGKTELTKAISKILFGNEKALIRLDMSEYMESHSISKIIGSPPGYVGFDEQSTFIEKVRKNPYSIILLDEVEKTHPDIMNIFLQVLEDGQLTDSHGKIINFKNSIIIMTSNAGARIITDKNKIGFDNLNSMENYENTKKDVINEAKKFFKPELLNRIDEIIVFNQLDKNSLEKIINILINKTQNKLNDRNIFIDVTENAKKIIIEKAIEYKYGARPLKRLIQENVENPISELIISKNDFFNKKIVFDGMENRVGIANIVDVKKEL